LRKEHTTMAAEDKDLNRDPLSDETGSHPVATGVGAAGGAAAGVAAGIVGGPAGMAVGGIVGAVVGALAGRAAGEAINPTQEDAHWRGNYMNESYYEQGRSYDDYGPAYRHGLESRSRYEDWDVAEPKLRSEWDSYRGGSSLNWDQARPASRAAWDRVDPHYRGTLEGSGSLSNYGTGLTSSDSSLPTGGQHERYSAGAASTTHLGSPGAQRDSDDHEDIRDTLEELLEACKDGEYGFQACAEQAQRADLKSFLSRRVEDCRRGAEELRRHLATYGGDTDEGGSTTGMLHRGWVSVKATLTRYDDKAVMEEAERGEDNALARYRKALQKPLPAEVRQMVQQQCDGVQRNHDEVKRLRNELRQAG